MGRVLRFLSHAPWLYPSEAVDWQLAAACLVLLVPFFGVSWLLEYLMARRILRNRPRRSVDRAVWLVRERRGSTRRSGNAGERPDVQGDDPPIATWATTPVQSRPPDGW